MKVIELLNFLTEYAKTYSPISSDNIKLNAHMNKVSEKVEQRIVDAVLVDFINYIALKHGIDYALYTKDLHEARSENLSLSKLSGTNEISVGIVK